MPASNSMSKLLSHPSSTSPSVRCLPRCAVAATFARNPGQRIASPPRSLRSSGRTGSSSGTSVSGAGGEGASAGERNEEGLPFVKMSSDILRTERSLLTDNAAPSFLLLATPPALRNGGRGEGHLEPTPAYPAAMNALYAASLAGNAAEHLWNFTWPAAVATLHQSLLPVAVLGFFTKLVVFAAGPLVGDLVSSLPRIPAYRSLSVIQTAAHLVSAATITHAFAVARASTAPELLLRPWFAVLVASTAVDRLSCVSLGIISERDFVVQLAGTGRPVALAQANATLSRVDLLCETAGASIFAFLLSKNDTLTCIKLSCAISLCALPVLIFMGGAMNRLADGIFDRSEHPRSSHAASAFDIRRTDGVDDDPSGRAFDSLARPSSAKANLRRGVLPPPPPPPPRDGACPTGRGHGAGRTLGEAGRHTGHVFGGARRKASCQSWGSAGPLQHNQLHLMFQ